MLNRTLMQEFVGGDTIIVRRRDYDVENVSIERLRNYYDVDIVENNEADFSHKKN